MALCEHCLGIALDNGRTIYPHQPSWRALQSSAKECSLCRLFREELQVSLAYARRNTEGFEDLTEDFVSKRGLLDDDLPQDWDKDIETTISVELQRKEGLRHSFLRVNCGPPENRLKPTPFGGDPQSYIQFRELQKGRDLQWFFRPAACQAFLDVYTLEGFALCLVRGAVVLITYKMIRWPTLESRWKGSLDETQVQTPTFRC